METQLTVVIVTFNVKELTRNCLNSLKNLTIPAKIIVSDNGSSDGTVEMVKKEFPNVLLLDNKYNLGFAKGNNRARKYCKGKYVLILNPDTVVEKGTIEECVKYIKRDEKLGALTCKIELWSGGLDKDSRRSFPTPWVALTHFSFLDRVFPKSKLFARYWYGFISKDEIHEIDVPQGAFFLVKKEVMDKIGWYDEDYFLDGEDIDIAYRIKQLDYKIIYYPKVKIIHYKGASKGKKVSGFQNTISPQTRKQAISSGMDSMKIFYKKHFLKKYPWLVSKLVFSGIGIIKTIRLLKYNIAHN
ncbi:glycosyl transferase family 2 [candidate division WWE3 bacterium CG09_land_8_20_14_0_10_39_24]|uniref:Glycosyl transferase family 2 n=1 Tax=candidate division WWE3 bacterium CG09_land_8_20_14_0_10_39_24 TaxID=1975088 RepID=A0A2H0WJE3_UNCKA|nr:MAG: hypothetical protein AUJ94_01430 [bacterium CG2_30_40_12]OJI08662.1 MAG: hypothetical protein BK003_02185 [bacterium CG09_39_24]PIS12767.1 MAG: glycosyl transferase family 2 [candidate division WWE3 bacterium CG09_land_8_20_14_0_10_39_24]PJE50451.1 MAG: glycosyl transferase family 2 [candidate division WWE3 bacterium CG10_big_fil_rev_8_21_14_0_10_39_14]